MVTFLRSVYSTLFQKGDDSSTLAPFHSVHGSRFSYFFSAFASVNRINIAKARSVGRQMRSAYIPRGGIVGPFSEVLMPHSPGLPVMKIWNGNPRWRTKFLRRFSRNSFCGGSNGARRERKIRRGSRLNVSAKRVSFGPSPFSAHAKTRIFRNIEMV